MFSHGQPEAKDPGSPVGFQSPFLPGSPSKCLSSSGPKSSKGSPLVVENENPHHAPQNPAPSLPNLTLLRPPLQPWLPGFLAHAHPRAFALALSSAWGSYPDLSRLALCFISKVTACQGAFNDPPF